MTINISLSKTFEIGLPDSTVISVTVCVEASTLDEGSDRQADQRIGRLTYDNVIQPLEDDLVELFIDEDFEIAMIGEAACGDMLTADDYPDCAQ
jgi:hypothetical protein